MANIWSEEQNNTKQTLQFTFQMSRRDVGWVGNEKLEGCLLIEPNQTLERDYFSISGKIKASKKRIPFYFDVRPNHESILF